MRYLNDTPPAWLEDIETLTTFGKRMKEARELAGLNMILASKLTGINRSVLKRIEEGLTVDEMGFVSPTLIANASKAYEVTSDFLLGLVEDDQWERTPAIITARACKVHFSRRLHTRIYIIGRDIARLEKQMKTAANQVDVMLDTVAYVSNALSRLIELNRRKFNNMPGGSRLVLAVTEAEKKVDEANRALIRREIFPIEHLYKERGVVMDDNDESVL